MPDTSTTTVQDTIAGYMQDLETLLKGIETKISGEQSQQQTAMTDFVKSESALWVSATSFGGPPPKVLAPTWKGGTEPKTASYEEAFEPRVKSVIFAPTAASAFQSIEDGMLQSTIAGIFQQAYSLVFTSAVKPTAKNIQELYLDWIATAIVTLASELDGPRRLDLQKQLIKVVMESQTPQTLLDAQKNGFSKTGKGANAKATGAYPTIFAKTVDSFVKEGQKSGADQEKVVEQILTNLEQALKKATRPDDEEQIRGIVRTTISALSTSLADNNTKEELTSELEDALTDLFPQPDKASFYLNVQSNLRKNLLKGALSDSTTSTASTSGSQGSGGSNSQADSEADQESDDNGEGGEATGGGTTGSTTASTSVNGGLDALIAEEVNKYLKGQEALQLIANLKQKTRGVVDVALGATFLELSEQGVQGRVISSVRDYQLVNRIAGYTEQVLNQLPLDLKERIPANQQNTLTTAQMITKASLSYRQFAQSLQDLTTAYKGEKAVGDKVGVQGTNANIVQNLVNGPPNGLDYKAKSLHEVSQGVYLARNKPSPMIKAAELTGVQLAADSAGLNTSLDQILVNEQSATLASLQALGNSFKQVMDEQIGTLGSAKDEYFKNVDSYVNDRVAWEVDQVDVAALETSLAELTNIVNQGRQDYMKRASNA